MDANAPPQVLGPNRNQPRPGAASRFRSEPSLGASNEALASGYRSEPPLGASPEAFSERASGQLTVHWGDQIRRGVDAATEQSSSISIGLDYVPLDRELRRGIEEYTLTHESMPDLVAITQALTQGSLPDLQEGSERVSNSDQSFSERPSEGSIGRTSGLSEHIDESHLYVHSSSDAAAEVPTQDAQPRGRSRLAEPGAEVPVRSSSVGSVRGVVTDSDDDYVKVMYFINSKACFKTIGRDEYLRELAAQSSSDMDDIFARSPTDSRTRNRANPQWSSERSGDSPRSHIVWGSENSNDSFCTHEAPRSSAYAVASSRHLSDHAGDTGNSPVWQQERGRSREKKGKKPLEVGSVVSVRSSSLGRCVEGIVTDLSSDRVMVQYFWNGRSCTKSMPRSAPEFED